jgi:hypothetical protein
LFSPHDIEELWTDAFNKASEHLKAARVHLTATETRWNSKLQVIERALLVDGLAPAVFVECEEACVILRPFAQVTDILQQDSATLFDTLLCMEGLTRYFISFRERQQPGMRGNVGREVADKILSTVSERKRMLLSRAYLVLAYFSPSTDYEQDSIERIHDVVRQALAYYEVPEEEWVRFKLMMPDADEDGVTRQSYFSRVDVIRTFCPRLAKVLMFLLNSSPSEAAVERLFSKLKFCFDQWRNRAGETLVNATLQVASGYAFYHSLNVVDRDIEATPTKTHRREPAAEPTPRTPATQVPADVDTGAEWK